MKILRICFANLNSLAGKWQIDFTRAEYTSNGIFAITGPTGSGKTTLLDAICLALYGRTPRLDRISESTNEIMSRHTGACFAEIEFETSGGLFRCHWSQRRAREKSAGKLQQPRHEIVDAKTDKVMENKIKEVARKVEEVCGMDFDQFTRSVLLAQGGFAAFLDAKGDERAPILEQITGTEIYSRISKKVHQKKNEEQHKLDLLEAEIGAVSLLTEEELSALQTELGEKKTLCTKVENELTSAQNAFAWLTTINALQEEISGLEAKSEQIHTLQQEAEPEKNRLVRAQKAHTLSAASLQLLELRKLQSKETHERQKSEKALTELELRAKELQKAHEEASILVKTAKKAYQAEILLCRKVRELDVKLQEAKERLDKLRQQEETTAKHIHAQKKELQEKESVITSKNQELSAASNYLQRHEKDAVLADDLAGFLEMGKSIMLLSAKCKSLTNELAGIQESTQQAATETGKAGKLHEHNVTAHKDAQDSLARVNKELDVLLQGRSPASLREEQNRHVELFLRLEKICRLGEQIAANRKELGDIEKRIRQATALIEDTGCKRQEMGEKISLQQQMVDKQRQLVFLTARINDYEEERKRLADGSPCPLCGSLSHPFCSETPVISSDAEQELQRLEETLKQQQNYAADLTATVAATTARIEQAEEARQKILNKLKIDENEQTELTKNLPCPPEAAEAELARVGRIRLEGEKLLHEVDDKMQEVSAAQEEEQKQKDTVHTSLQAMQQAEHTEHLVLENLHHLQEQIDQAEGDLDKGLQDLSQRLASHGVDSASIDTLERNLDELGRRRQSWKQQQELEHQITQDINTLKIQIERAKSLLEQFADELQAAGEQLRRGQDRFDSLFAQRRELYQDKDPDKEEQKAAESLGKAEAAFAALDQESRRLEKDKAVLNERHDYLKRATTERSAVLERQEKEFLYSLKEKGFTDESDFQSSVVSEKDMAAIAASLEALEKQAAEIATHLAGKKQSLARESQKHLTDQSVDELKKLIEEKTGALHLLQQQVGRTLGKLQDNDEQIKKQQSRYQARQSQQQEYRRWQALHDLIGSNDGKKFRNFAQGVTFEIMIGHANRSLQMMTDRYLLIRDAVQPLELNVIDTYQAGEIRSTKNLSGGESFIVSLALALGLAGMGGSDVKVDSLFLDEGFGTLDEDSLETALETLASLQQEGKVIGIISHVPVLQERIATRIQVFPGPAGTSSLEGPGISKL